MSLSIVFCATIHSYYVYISISSVIFLKGLNAPPTVELLKDLLLRFECAIRRPVLHSVWWNTLGHTRLIRITVEDRERRQRHETKKKKQEKDLWAAEPDDDEVIWVKHLKVGSVLKRTLWRQNDEGYRVNGRGALGGWLWKSKTFHRTFIPQAKKPDIGGNLEPTSPANKKAIRLEEFVSRLNEWRTAELECEQRKWQVELLKKCYSPTCRIGMMPVPITSENDSVQGCYSLACRQAVLQSMGRTTSGVVHARPTSLQSRQENGKDVKALEMNKPFPLPVPFDYRVRRTGEQSLLVLPQRALKRLARQGGVNLNYLAPGFHRMAKSNIQVWNYPCQRPLFDNCWRYLVLRAQSYHSIALHLRVLYACIRWADMHREPDEDFRVTVHLADHDEVRTVIGHKEYPPDGMYEQYKLSVELIPLDDNVDLDDASESLGSAPYHPSKSLEKTLRKRKATKGRSENGAVRKDHVKVVERWIDGIELKPWEIANYWKNAENRTRRSLATPSVVTVGNKLSAPVVRHYESPIVHPNRISAERHRPQPKRMPDYDYDIKDDEDDEDDDDEYIDVETLPSVAETKKSISSSEPRLKIPRLLEQKSGRQFDESLYRAHWHNPNVHRQHEQMPRRAGELLGGGKYTMFQKSDGTLCRVMVYQNRAGQGTRATSTVGSVRPPSAITSQLRPETYQRESLRIPVTRRIVSVPGTSHGSPAAPIGKRLLLIRRSDGTTQYLRPVTGGTGSAGAYRAVRTTQAGGATISDVRGAPTSSPFVRPISATRTVFTGNQSVGRVVRLPAVSRTVAVVNHPSTVGNQADSTVRIGRVQPDTKRTGDDEVLSDHSDPITAQGSEEYRLIPEKNRSIAKPPGSAPSPGNGRVVSDTKPAVTVQQRQGLSTATHSSIEQQTSSGQIFGDHDPMSSQKF
ncbi:unnamed protein product [Litomosoides sigmodontis]|uniref:Uncharacterized protein n=1 Tax=Litomosoides sigmodontis TaxID=42156 RepID=A0A3P6TC45_LITSI|nr:unnamed protein product [Litomosoides sigmodontis]